MDSRERWKEALDPDSRIGLLHLISGLTLGGAERMLLWSAQTHDRDRFRMGVVSLMSGGELARPIREEGVPVFELGWARGKASPSGLRRLVGTVRGFSPRILQGHLFHGNLLARLAGAFVPGALVVNTLHMEMSRESPARRLLYRLTRPLARGVVGYSPDDRVVEAAGGPPAVRLIPYGVLPPAAPSAGGGPLRSGLGVPPGARMVLAAGRLSPEKGFDVLLSALALLPPAPDLRLVLAGEGSLRGSLERRARETGVEAKVVFAGARRDLPDLMAASDLFVLPSVWDGAPRVVLEAMASGAPVVATLVGAVPGMVLDGETGLLVPPGRADLLAAAMLRALSDPAARGWGEAGRRRARERFDYRRTQEEFERFYLELLGKGERE